MDNPSKFEEKLEKLVRRFGDNLDEYKKSNYDESNTRADFIDKFFELLGWDVYNKQGYSEDFREVVREDKVYIAGKPKSPDYSFRIGSQKQFFVEAKKPSVNIYADAAPAFQLRRYAYTANLPISILTDFEELAIYDTSIKPNVKDNSAVARIFYCKFDEYHKHWEFFNNTFSREAVLKGKLKNYAKSDTKKKGTQSIDRELLLLIENWRNELARNIALRNNNLGIYNLNEAVQKTIDRIIFLRIAEDRNTEIYGQLQTFASQKDIYSILVKLFDSANKKYNSGLFKPLGWLDKIIIDDKVLKAIITDLYYPNPYEFSVLPIEILGHIYEQFLGKTIRLTASHQAKIEEKPEVRKAGGVYYTPSYIVDYIVQNTVGKKIEGKSPDKITSLTVLDPACGSGSFLVGAFKFLLDWHLSYWTDNKNLKKGLKDGHIYQVETNTYRLTFRTKKSILLNNIYGVDIDSQAVEVTKLSLLLTLMEGEIVEASSELFFKNNKEALLPDLESNIKCGNSLIDSSFYDGQDLTLFDEHQQRKINTFDWEREFKKIFDGGGFDCVIGNPPYGAELSDVERKYIKTKHSINTTDTAAVFMKYSTEILNENGINSFIVPKPFVYASNWKQIQSIMIDKITDLIDCSKVWKEVKLEQIIYVYNKGIKSNKYNSLIRKNENFVNLGKIDKKSFKDFGFILNGINKKELEIAYKMIKSNFFLNDVCLNQRGAPLQKYVSNNESKYKVLGGKEINRYYFNKNIKGYLNEDFYNNEKLNINKNSILVQRIVAHLTKPIDHIKIIAISNNQLNQEEYLIVDTINQLTNKSNYGNYFLLSLVNSKLISWFAYRFIFGKAIRTVQFDNPTTSRIPIPKLDLSKTEDKAQHDKLVSLVEQMLEAQKALQSAISDSEKKFAKQKVELLDKQIDMVVYELYGLSEEEIKVVEGKAVLPHLTSP